ncbi:MAG: EF-hand domain-containing protein [bacterium JZ-2024 1]
MAIKGRKTLLFFLFLLAAGEGEKPVETPPKAVIKRGPVIWIPPILGFLDKNKNGIITREEFVNGYPEVIFPLVDTDKDDVITLKEYQEAEKKARESAEKNYYEEAKKMDADGDGFLSEQEWKGDEKVREEADTNKDGKISQAEYVAQKMKGWYHLLFPLTQASARGKVSIFEGVDANGDKKVTREEMKKAAGEFFAMWDYTKDGLITPADAVAAGEKKKEKSKSPEGK